MGNIDNKEIVKEIINSEKIAILPHVYADGDALGSSFGLAIGLAKMNKDIEIILEEEIPTNFSFLPGQNFKKDYKFEGSYYDLVISLDSGDVGRLGMREELLSRGRKTINIDHHATNTMFGYYNIVDPAASSVGEMLYYLLNDLKVELDNEIATCLYVSICTDTGGFRYSNTNSNTHKVISDLLKYEVDVADISKRVFDDTSLIKLKLMSLAVNNMEIIENGRVAVTAIRSQKAEEIGAKEEDFNGLVNLGRNIRGVEVSVFIRELAKNQIKVNLRSNYYFNVAKLAGMYGGGGHKRAAGCIVDGDLDKIKKNIIDDLISELYL